MPTEWELRNTSALDVTYNRAHLVHRATSTSCVGHALTTCRCQHPPGSGPSPPHRYPATLCPPARPLLPPPLFPRVLQIAEEQPLQLDAAMPGGQKAGDVLVPRVLGLLGAPSPDLRALAVSTLNQLSNVMPPALLDNMDRCACVCVFVFFGGGKGGQGV